MVLLNTLFASLQFGYKNNRTIIHFHYKKSNFVIKILKKLTEEGFIIGFNKCKNNPLYYLNIKLKYCNKNLPAIKSIIFFKKFTCATKSSIAKLNKTTINIILGTNYGILTKNSKLNIGGQLICLIN